MSTTSSKYFSKNFSRADVTRESTREFRRLIAKTAKLADRRQAFVDYRQASRDHNEETISTAE